MGRLEGGDDRGDGIGDAVPGPRSRPGRKSLPVGAVAACLRASRRPLGGGPSRKHPGAQAVRHQGLSGTAAYRGTDRQVPSKSKQR